MTFKVTKIDVDIINYDKLSIFVRTLRNKGDSTTTKFNFFVIFSKFDGRL